MDLTLPFEKVVSTAVEQISTGVQLKVSQIEEQRNRDFMLQMKEFEFYKSNYEKDLKDIFDYWFNVIRVIHIKDNQSLSEQDRIKYKKEYEKLINVNMISKYQMNTLKYARNETARILALARSAIKLDDNYANLFVWTAILSVLKKMY